MPCGCSTAGKGTGGINRATSLPAGFSGGAGGSQSSAGGTHGDPQARALLADFLRKVLRLAALRLADLCDRMDFHPMPRADVLAQVGCAFHHCWCRCCPLIWKPPVHVMQWSVGMAALSLAARQLPMMMRRNNHTASQKYQI